MDRRFEIAGKEWLVRVSRLRGKAAGWCDYSKCKILVDSGLDPEAFLETLVHEVIHAEFPMLSEEAVTNSAADLAKILVSFGYTRKES